VKKEAPLNILAGYLPVNSLDKVLIYLHEYKVHLTITKARQTVLGDYRQPDCRRGHRISINGNLNPYEFLLTLLHELAHLIAFIEFGPSILSHGKEWKHIYRKILLEFTGKGLFPEEVEGAVFQSLQNPAASKCAEEGLTRVLKKYDQKPAHYLLVEELNMGDLFLTKDDRVFERREKIRTRYRCREVRTGKIYLFSPVYEVRKKVGINHPKS
jgi:SprT-like family